MRGEGNTDGEWEGTSGTSGTDGTEGDGGDGGDGGEGRVGFAGFVYISARTRVRRGVEWGANME